MKLNGPEAASLYDEHVDAIYGYAARRVGPEISVLIVEEVFEEALSKDAQRPEHISSDLGWLLGLATAFLRRHSETECNRLRNWTPQHRPTSHATPDVTDPLLTRPSEDTSAKTTARVMAAIAELEPLERDLLLLVAWQGCSSSMTAAATGVPQGDVRGRLAKIRKQIRHILSTEGRTAPASVDSPAPDAPTQLGRKRVINPVQVVEAARPEVGPMPTVERRHLRERIFDAAMRSRTEHSPVEVNSPNNRAANLLRLAVLGLLGAAAIGGLFYSASRETAATEETETGTTSAFALPTTTVPGNTIHPVPPPTAAPTTTTPPRAGDPGTPLLLPPDRNRLDELKIDRADLGGSALMLQAPDLSIISLLEIDGLAPEPQAPSDDTVGDDPDATTTTTLAPRQFAGVLVEAPTADAPGQYSVEVPCGSVTVYDLTGQPIFRPEIHDLFDLMRINGGVVEVNLPPGWTAISSGPTTDEFLFGLPVEFGDRQATITLTQYPGGSLAQAGLDQLPYGPATFNGQPALIYREPDRPEALEVVAMVGSTAIKLVTDDLSVAEAETVVNGLTPGTLDEWTNRFGTLPTEIDPDIRRCSDQPSFSLAD